MYDVTRIPNEQTNQQKTKKNNQSIEQTKTKKLTPQTTANYRMRSAQVNGGFPLKDQLRIAYEAVGMSAMADGPTAARASKLIFLPICEELEDRLGSGTGQVSFVRSSLLFSSLLFSSLLFSFLMN